MIFQSSMIIGQNIIDIETWMYGLNSKNSISNQISSNLLFLPALNFQANKDLYQADVQIQFKWMAKDQTSSPSIYLGENLYFSIPVQSVRLIFGRKLFSNPVVQSWKDGWEGLLLEGKLSDSITYGVVLIDFYRGFPLLQKEYLTDLSKENNLKLGERYRHALYLNYVDKLLSMNFYFKYLNLGNWGVHSNEVKESRPSGDNDFIYTTGFQFGYKYNSFGIYTGVEVTRGIDKTVYNYSRKEKSIPFSGELFTLNLRYQSESMRINWTGFLPDRDKTNAQGEILELGYVGTGSYPQSGILIGQVLNYHPSMWIAPTGLEKSNGILGARNQSFLSILQGEYLINRFSLGVGWDYVLPYLITASSKSEMSIRKADFSRQFISETYFKLQYGDKKSDQFYMSLTLSRMFSSKTLKLESNLIQISASVLF